ncbi:helix-turn-helix domain-containing protein [Teichococcus aestuarii]|uniref:helix-turn-helix domain-containing protein n=1 Tax=Teichococcus aestuarii TaxID=568898 RepID=UPI0015E8041B|nr:helix-turn-helix domain-containing protein [Pseudoroseomonas aestuarii]
MPPETTVASQCALTLAQTAERLSIAYITAWRMVQRGDFPAVRVGRSWRIEPDALRSWLDAKRSARAEAAQ